MESDYHNSRSHQDEEKENHGWTRIHTDFSAKLIYV